VPLCYGISPIATDKPIVVPAGRGHSHLSIHHVHCELQASIVGLQKYRSVFSNILHYCIFFVSLLVRCVLPALLNRPLMPVPSKAHPSEPV
jgi:hypothetical protein